MEDEVHIKGECVCGSTHFVQDGGKTFCMECQTELETAKEIFYEAVDYGPDTGDLTQRSRVLTTTVKKTNVKAKELPTSWECFNQILCNLVDEVEQVEDNIFGSINQDFKLTVLQLWAAYLRYHGKAFFSKDATDYPKFNSPFDILDAEIIYKIKRPKKAYVKRNRKPNVNTRRTRKRNIRKMQKRDNQLELSKMQKESVPKESETTQPSIPFQFTPQARKYLRNMMSEEHFKEHENNPTLKCHKIRYKDRPHKPEALTKQKLYILIAMALNHVESEIQLADLIRFLREGHVSLQISSPVSSDARYNLDFHNKVAKGFPSIPDHSNMRSLSSILAKQIGFKFKKLDMSVLCKRYLHELCLPPEIGSLVDVILKTCPPTMGPGEQQKNYEGRAMAYILFSLKLLFGLDDKREYLISASAREINQKIAALNSKHSDAVERKQLFIWSDWVEYIEMRNIILIQLHCPTAMQSFAHSEGMTSMYLDHLKKFNEKYAEVKSEFKSHAKLMQRVRDHIQATYSIEPKLNDKMTFYPTLTPKRTYLEEVHFSGQTDVFVPAYMDAVHDTRDIESFLDSSTLQSFFQQHRIKLVVQKLKYNGVTTGEYPVDLEFPDNRFTEYNHYNFDISTEKWLSTLKEKEKVVEDKLATKDKQNRISIGSVDCNRNKASEATADDSLSNGENVLQCISSDDDEDAETNSEAKLDFFMSNFDYWMLCLSLQGSSNRNEFADFRNKLSKTFQWLLKQGAELIENQEIDLYCELMAIECYFNKDLTLIEKINSKFDY